MVCGVCAVRVCGGAGQGRNVTASPIVANTRRTRQHLARKPGALRYEQFNASGVFYELYDHRGDREDDFDAFENVNLATDPAHRQTTEEMERLVEEM